MKMATSDALAMLLLLLAVCAAASATPGAAAMDGDVDGGLLVDLQLQQDPCPQVEDIVRSVVQQALRRNFQLTAGLLRLFFHDCFPQGCDASVLLAGERDVAPNDGSLQPEALKLIEDIRREVHGRCGGPKVSCADILALATRDAVVAAGFPFFPIVRGRMDSRTPAAGDLGQSLPSPFDPVDVLLTKFRGKQGLGDPRDLVALSGGHTVGKAKCGLIRGNDAFSRALAANCSDSRKQSLDVVTPDAFDKGYFVALQRRQGVLLSDQGLADHPLTRGIVAEFANDQNRFFDQFRVSMTKLSQLKPKADGGNFEIRNDCSKPNPRRVNDLEQQQGLVLAASA